jgi:acetylornithine deacetylase/succinyl-diaminopimelate desuccinylase-like protein
VTPDGLERAQDEVVDLCGELIRIDTTNGVASERAAADYVAAMLGEVGIDSTIVESEPGRASLVARMEGGGAGDGALLVHHHLDVVPADPAEWAVHPFSGEVVDGCVWGRGAVDMKNSVAATLAVVRWLARAGTTPGRDLILAFNADEEAGGHKGVKYVAGEHPHLLDGATEAIGEVGGFSLTIDDDHRLYLIQVAEKGQAWMRLTASGTPGHAAMQHDDNAIARLAAALVRLSEHEFPTHLIPSMTEFFAALAGAYGVSSAEASVEELLDRIGPLRQMIAPSLRHTANPTVLEAGQAVNVVPGRATAYVDGRFLPGLEGQLEAEVEAVLGEEIAREWIHHDRAVETTFDGALVDRMRAAVLAEDDGAELVPFCMPAATDAKTYAARGIRCFGFAPLRLPAGFDFAALFHGTNERVPVESLRFSVRALARLLSDL